VRIFLAKELYLSRFGDTYVHMLCSSSIQNVYELSRDALWKYSRHLIIIGGADITSLVSRASLSTFLWGMSFIITFVTALIRCARWR